MRSQDGGETWEEQSVGAGLTGQITKLRFLDADVAYYLGGGVRKSTDGGQHWQTIFDKAAFDLTVLGRDIIIVVGSGQLPGSRAIRRSFDGGNSWTKVWEDVGAVDTLITNLSFVTPELGWAVGLAYDSTRQFTGNVLLRYTGAKWVTISN